MNVLGGGGGGGVEGGHFLVEEKAEESIEGQGDGIEDGASPERNLDAITARHGIMNPFLKLCTDTSTC